MPKALKSCAKSKKIPNLVTLLLMFWSEKGWWGAKISVTRFGEISRLWHNVKALWPFWKCSLCIWLNVELMLANFLCYWTYFDGVNSQILKVIYLVIWTYCSVHLTLTKVLSKHKGNFFTIRYFNQEIFLARPFLQFKLISINKMC